MTDNGKKFDDAIKAIDERIAEGKRKFHEKIDPMLDARKFNFIVELENEFMDPDIIMKACEIVDAYLQYLTVKVSFGYDRFSICWTDRGGWGGEKPNFVLEVPELHSPSGSRCLIAALQGWRGRAID